MAKERLADVQGQAELLKAFREVIEKLPHNPRLMRTS
jgi:hypothetical protein